jgi:hypothetical protein
MPRYHVGTLLEFCRLQNLTPFFLSLKMSEHEIYKQIRLHHNNALNGIRSDISILIAGNGRLGRFTRARKRLHDPKA